MLLRIFRDVALAVINAVLVLSMSGSFELARAATSCNDPWFTTFVGVTYKYSDKLDHFTSYGGKTYAYAKLQPTQDKITTGVGNGRASLYGMKALIDSSYPGASLPKISDGNIQQMLTAVFGPLITAAGQPAAYIGLMNKNDGAGYVYMDGSGPTSYYNWPSGQPNPALVCKSSDGISGADPYVVMIPNGTWRTICDGATAPVFEFQDVFDCAVPYAGSGSTPSSPASNLLAGPGANLKQCDATNYDGFGLYANMTYAITKQPMTWSGAKTLASSSGGKLVYIGDKGTNDFIVSQLASFMGGSTNVTGNKAWIGLYDPASVASWCLEGTTPCPTMPERFQWISEVSTYKNWAPNQPDNA